MREASSPPKAQGSHFQQQSGADVRLRILCAIESGRGTDGRSPSYHEIRVATGIRALSHVKHHHVASVKQGLLLRLSGSRGLRPARPVGLPIRGAIALLNGEARFRLKTHVGSSMRSKAGASTSLTIATGAQHTRIAGATDLEGSPDELRCQQNTKGTI